MRKKALNKIENFEKKKGYFVGFFVESIKKEKSILITKQWRIY